MEYALEKGEVVCIDASAGRQMLQAVSGIIWLTCSADPRDHILTPGSSFLVNQAESIVLEALEAASFSLAAVAAAGSSSTFPARSCVGHSGRSRGVCRTALGLSPG